MYHEPPYLDGGNPDNKKYFYTESSPDHDVSPHSEQAMARFDANKQLELPI